MYSWPLNRTITSLWLSLPPLSQKNIRALIWRDFHTRIRKYWISAWEGAVIKSGGAVLPYLKYKKEKNRLKWSKVLKWKNIHIAVSMTQILGRHMTNGTNWWIQIVRGTASGLDLSSNMSKNTHVQDSPKLCSRSCCLSERRPKI